jgi:hypothetical protein
MNAQLVRKHRFFFSWQDREKQSWLEQMARQGLHLQQAGAFGGYTFTKGDPSDVAYRLDYQRGKAPADYLQLIKDAGWEHVAEQGGWQYWRKPIVDGKVPELFTDHTSRIQMYQRVQAIYITSAPALYIIGLAAFKRFPGRHPLWFVILYIALFMCWMIFCAVNFFMILARINALKKEISL